MCGFSGYLKLKNTSSDAEMRSIVRDMGKALQSRGPDGSGEWIDSEAGYAVAHRRLSIIDLSEAGHQPMSSPNGRYIIAYNGEIYNLNDLRKKLAEAGANFVWRGHSDTEVLLACIETWGVSVTLNAAVGMFAFALWDCDTREVTLARDRFGEKPLYFGWQGSGKDRSLLFGSELKALEKHPAFERKISRDALTLLMRHNYIPAPYSIYEGISKILPGSILITSADTGKTRSEIYWDAIERARLGAANKLQASAPEAIDRLEEILGTAVRQQMISDVSLGAFLSGGIDSSAIVALMQAQSSKPVMTFTIGFAEKEFNEAVHAKAVAQHLGTDHHELYIDAAATLNVIPKLPQIYCEPFADSSQIPTYLVSKLTQESVTVSLSGDAGDELFGGYNRYAMTDRLWKWISLVPMPLRALAAKSLSAIPPEHWDRIGGKAAERRFRMFGDKVHKGAGVLSCASSSELYLRLVSAEQNPELWVSRGQEPPTVLTGNRPDLSGFDDIESMMLLDTLSYLPDDILTKVDRAAMAVSLETRVPFLDHRVFEFAWTLPQDYKIRNGQTKWLLRQLLYRHVPAELIDRPKMGFGVPVSEWLRGPLRAWAETLLDERRLETEGYWNTPLVRQAWRDHVDGRRNWSGKLWTVLMFQAWNEAA